MKQMQCRSLRAYFLALALITVGVAAAPSRAQDAAAFDGPYVVSGSDDALQALTVAGSAEGETKSSVNVKAGDEVRVPAVGRAPSFSVALRSPGPIEPDVRTTSKDAPVFVVADTHGEYEILVELLQKHRVIDASMRWSFGRGHLVFLGDVFDRGPNQTEILWLIYKLEGESAKSGGGTHLVLGNHEVMVLSGDVRYLNPKYIRTAQALGVDSYSTLFGPRTLLGQWLRSKPVVLKLNDLLCLHGGISPAVVERKLTLHDINSTARGALTGAAAKTSAGNEQAAFMMGKLGPVWYRGYFADQTDFPTATAADVDEIRKHFDVDKILVGHTIVPRITPLYDGKVIAVQVYPHRDENSGQAVMEALLFKDGRSFRARADGRVEELE